MAKKVFFFLAIMLILLTASVNVFAAETDALEPEASLTNDKGEIIISSLEENIAKFSFLKMRNLPMSLYLLGIRECSL